MGTMMRSRVRSDRVVEQTVDEALELAAAAEERLAWRLLGVVHGAEEAAGAVQAALAALPKTETIQVTLPTEALDTLPGREPARVDTADLFEAFLERLQPVERLIVRGRLEGWSQRDIALEAYPDRSPRCARLAVARDLARIWAKWKTFVCS